MLLLVLLIATKTEEVRLRLNMEIVIQISSVSREHLTENSDLPDPPILVGHVALWNCDYSKASLDNVLQVHFMFVFEFTIPAHCSDTFAVVTPQPATYPFVLPVLLSVTKARDDEALRSQKPE